MCVLETEQCSSSSLAVCSRDSPAVVNTGGAPGEKTNHDPAAALHLNAGTRPSFGL